jgi:SPP1 family predicted phage head-tail adaptor
MRAGELNRLIKLKRVLTTTDPDTLEKIESGEVYASSVPATVVFRSGNERYSDGLNIIERVAVIKIRYRSDVKNSDIVEYEGKDYSVEFIKPLGRRQGLELTCEQAP